MSINEIFYTLAYCIFIYGASSSFRENGSSASVVIMLCGISIDFLTSMLPLAGVDFLKMDVGGTNAVIVFAIVFGFCVWMLFAAALIVRTKGSLETYHRLITVVQIAWFIDFIAFLWGIYKFPVQ
ncbi:MAG: hypothetical protein FJ119_14335 [Deltaproteobacteria bacterium]|nr:hypothetical protein [Deltaproteobacteria bacterium]